MTLLPATITGLAIGDALGMPFETHHFSSQALLDWDGSFRPGITNEVQPDREAGNWTDDTKMALGLAESILDDGTYNPVTAAAKYMEWYESGDHRGIGKATREAMERLRKGHHWTRSGVPHAEGNGAAMRIAPLGLFFRKNLLTVEDMSRIDARITHRGIEAEDGAVAVALGVALLAERVTSRENIFVPLLHFLGQGTLGQRLRVVQKVCQENPSPESIFQCIIEMGTGARAIETVPTAFLCFATTTSFKDAVEIAVRVGGDTDTRAAMTGALAGTFYGKKHVEPYLSDLEDGEYLMELDHLLYEHAPEIPDDT